jgi:hypothetical protein
VENTAVSCQPTMDSGIVRVYKGWVRNVALIKCTLGPGKSKEGWNFGREGTGGQMGNKGS